MGLEGEGSGGEGEGSGVKEGGKWGERGREVGIGYPPVHPLKKVSLFSQYYYHSSCPAYLVLNFVYLTNDCGDFCTWKSPSIPTFLHQ